MVNFKKMNLQFFAEDTNNDNKDTKDNDNTNNDKKDDDSNKSLTLDDVKKLIQSETDKVRTEYSKQLKSKDKELEDLKKEKMTEKEKLEYELNQKSDELSKREKDLLDKEMTIVTIDLLTENKLPLEVKPFVMGSSKEDVAEKVKLFKTMFDNAVKSAVDERFKQSGKEYQKGDTSNGEVTKEHFSKMSYTERLELHAKNPELYNKLK